MTCGVNRKKSLFYTKFTPIDYQNKELILVFKDSQIFD